MSKKKITNFFFIFVFSLIIVNYSVTVTDTLAGNFSYQQSQNEIGWYLNQINATSAWNITKGSEGIVVAIIDSGIDFSHPEISPEISHPEISHFILISLMYWILHFFLFLLLSSTVRGYSTHNPYQLYQ